MLHGVQLVLVLAAFALPSHHLGTCHSQCLVPVERQTELQLLLDSEQVARIAFGKFPIWQVPLEEQGQAEVPHLSILGIGLMPPNPVWHSIFCEEEARHANKPDAARNGLILC